MSDMRGLYPASQRARASPCDAGDESHQWFIDDPRLERRGYDTGVALRHVFYRNDKVALSAFSNEDHRHVFVVANTKEVALISLISGSWQLCIRGRFGR